MNSTKRILTILVCLLLYSTVVAQEPQSSSASRDTVSREGAVSETTAAGTRPGRNASRKLSPQAIKGFNAFDTPTPGRIAKFDNFGFLINSVIAEDALGRIGIGTTTPGSALTVAGRIESKEGGIKFPDGTVQLTSAAASLFQVSHNTTLTGNGTSASPLGVNIPALGLLSNVAHDATLAGNGMSAMPLGVAIPLSLSGSLANPILKVVATGAGGFDGIMTMGSQNVAGVGGAGLRAIGADSEVGGAGVIAMGGSGLVADGFAGGFIGNVDIQGTLSKTAGSFRIDHPLDPANKYLYHSFVESPDMMNVYNGNITTDANGEAIVRLPEYFEALNHDFRYQLTVIGQFAQAIVASEISDNSFTIKTDRPGVKVSWQVTGIRQDAYAIKHRIPVEEDKPERERGYYLHPQVFNQPEEKSVEWARHPEMMRQIKSLRQEAELRRLEKK